MLVSVTFPHAVDIAFFSILMIACVAGSIRGASGEIARLLALAGGAAAMFFLYKFLVPLWNNNTLAFSLALPAAVIIVLIINHLARKFIRILFGQPTDAIVGAVMAVIGAFLICVILMCAMCIVISENKMREVLNHSHAGRLTKPLVERIVNITENII